MTNPTLTRRLDRLAPPAPAMQYTSSPIDPRTLDSMREYLAGRITKEPDVCEEVHQAMLDYLAGNGPLAPC